VALREGQTFGFEDMAEYLRSSGLRIQAVPEQLELVASVPRNPAGKILKHTLRETYSAAPPKGGEA